MAKSLTESLGVSSGRRTSRQIVAEGATGYVVKLNKDAHSVETTQFGCVSSSPSFPPLRPHLTHLLGERSVRSRQILTRSISLCDAVLLAEFLVSPAHRVLSSAARGRPDVNGAPRPR